MTRGSIAPTNTGERFTSRFIKSAYFERVHGITNAADSLTAIASRENVSFVPKVLTKDLFLIYILMCNYQKCVDIKQQKCSIVLYIFLNIFLLYLEVLMRGSFNEGLFFFGVYTKHSM